MKKINLQNFLKMRIWEGDSGSGAAWPVSYVRDWKIVVLIFAVGMILLSIFAWRIYLSNKIAGGYLAPVVESSNISDRMVDRKKLQEDLLLLESKQINYNKTKNSHVKLTDPSI